MADDDIPPIGETLKHELGQHNEVPFHEVYEVGDKIGEGKFGTVYKTWHVTESDSPDKKIFAVKVEKRRKAKKDHDAAITEVSILKSLRNVPNIIKLYDFFLDEKRLYTIMALAAGGDVLDRLVSKEVYTEFDARDLAQLLLETVQNIHDRHIVHRDIKPENLLLTDNVNDSQIYLCDFGYAKRLSKDDEEGGMVTVCGTPEYMAPELWNGSIYDNKVDMWSIGVLLFILLGGYFPFGEDRKGNLVERITTEDYDFQDEVWEEDVSDYAKETLINILKADPKRRWSPTEALNSPWFISSTKEQLRNSNLRRSLQSLKEFNLNRKFKRAVGAVQTCNFLRKSLAASKTM